MLLMMLLLLLLLLSSSSLLLLLLFLLLFLLFGVVVVGWTFLQSQCGTTLWRRTFDLTCAPGLLDVVGSQVRYLVSQCSWKALLGKVLVIAFVFFCFFRIVMHFLTYICFNHFLGYISRFNGGLYLPFLMVFFLDCAGRGHSGHPCRSVRIHS